MNKIEVIDKEGIIDCTEEKIVVSRSNDTLDIRIDNDVIGTLVIRNAIYDNINIMVKDEVNATILEIKDDHTKGNTNYKYILGTGSKIIVNKFYYTNEYNETDIIDLNGMKANILFNLRVMSFSNQQYNITVNHNAVETISNIVNHGVAFDNSALDMVVREMVSKGMNNCLLNQSNKIMLLGTGKGTIKPELYIDNHTTNAHHGASLGRFNEDEIFYLETRGIPESEGYHLLLEGFLLGNMNLDKNIKQEFSDIIKKFRR